MSSTWDFNDAFGGAPPVVLLLVCYHLTIRETAQICLRFGGDNWHPNGQVMWSGIPRGLAQKWADNHDMQTLTTAMGPLMDSSHDSCLQSSKSADAWGKYMKGASTIFAWHISRGERVTVLLPPPPNRFNPFGASTYQTIEEPILKGVFGHCGVSRIDAAHPTVRGAENFIYQLWPVDEIFSWLAKYHGLPARLPRWRRPSGSTWTVITLESPLTHAKVGAILRVQRNG